MKKSLSKKKIILVAISIILVIVVAIAIYLNNKAEQEKQRLAAIDDIKRLVNDIFVYHKEGEEALLKEKIANITKTKWMEEEFIKQGTAAIQKNMFDATYGAAMGCFRIKQQQLLLEESGYECPQFQQAYVEMLNKQFHQQEEYFGFVEIANDALNGAIDEEEIYNRKLSYYSDPKSVFLSDYAPAYFSEREEAAISTKDSAALLELCKSSAAVRDYMDVSALVDMDAILNCLITDAEEITIKEGEGYYAGRTDEADTDFEYEDYGPGEFVYSKSRTVKYYGDLAYIFSSSDRAYRDNEGNSTAGSSKNHNEVYLKDERISWSSIKEAFIQYASEDGMVSYHKDGYCFAISNGAIVCFVGDSFLYEFVGK